MSEITYSVTYQRNGDIHEHYKRGDEYHNIGDRPAFVSRTSRGDIIQEKHMKRGKVHRTGDKPAIIYRTDEGREVQYWKHGVLFRESGPTIVTYDHDGNLTSEQFCNNFILEKYTEY